MRIGLITNYYPPEVGSNSYLYQSLAHYLGSRGHEVFVITGQPRYHVPDGTGKPAAWTKETPNVVVVRAEAPHFRSGGFLMRCWYGQARKRFIPGAGSLGGSSGGRSL